MCSREHSGTQKWRHRGKIEGEPVVRSGATGSCMPTKSSISTEPTSSRPYGFPGGPEGLLPWSWAEQRLTGSHNYWLATIRQDSRPHLMVIWGLWHVKGVNLRLRSRHQVSRFSLSSRKTTATWRCRRPLLIHTVRLDIRHSG